MRPALMADSAVCTRCNRTKMKIAFSMRKGRVQGICKECATNHKRIREQERKAIAQQNAPDLHAMVVAFNRWRAIFKRPLTGAW